MELTKELLLAYQRRWQAVAQVERAEQRSATVYERWQRLNSLLRMAESLDLRAHRNDRLSSKEGEHWNRLRAMYVAKRQDV